MSHKNPRSAADRPPPKTAVNLLPQNLNKTNGLLSSRIHRTLSRLLGLALTLTALSLLPVSVAPVAAQITGITVTTSPDKLVENDTAQTITVTATLNGGTYNVDKNYTITIAESAPAFLFPPATLNTDFTHTLDSTNNTVTIPANQASATTSFTVTAKIDNDFSEGKEYFVVTVPLSQAPNDNSTGEYITIYDAIPYALSVDTALLNESDDSTDITVTATKTSGTAPTTATTVTLALGGTAVEDTDYDATIPDFTIPANANSATATLTIDPTSDSTLGECRETIVVSGTTDTAILLTPTTILLNDEKSPCFSDPSVIDTHVFYSSQSAAQTVNLPTATPSGATFTLSDPADHTRPTWLTFDASTPSLTVAANATAADSVCYTLTASNTANSVTHTATRTACVAVIADVCSSATGWHPRGQIGPAITPNAGLTKDCNILMAAKSTLAGTSTALDWATDKRLWNNSGDGQGRWKGGMDGTADGVDWFAVECIHLNGTIPGVLGGLTGPTQFYLTSNHTNSCSDLTPGDLHGAIPKELGSLTSLEWLLLRRNKLSGPIPPELGNLTELTLLELHGNQLTGPPPSELSQLSQLSRLLAYNNRFTGPIPEWLGKLTALTYLDLGSNFFTGKIPTVLSTLTDLTALKLGANQLTGGIPEELGLLPKLKHLLLWANPLGGSIPSTWGSASHPLPELKELALEYGQLTGDLPENLSKLPKLEWLYLHYNALTGAIPTDFKDLAKVTALQFFHNDSVCLPEIPADTTDTTYADINALHTWYNALQDDKKDAVEVHCVHTAPPAPRATLSGGAVTVSWSDYTFADSTYTTSHYEVLYQRNDGYWISPENAIVAASTTTFTLPALPEGSSYQKVRYRALDDIAKANPTDPTRYVGTTWSPPVSTTPGGGDSGSGGNGGGVVSPPADQHGNTPETATAVSVNSRTEGRIDPRGDLDYFLIDVPQNGWLIVETTGYTDTRGTLWDAVELLGEETAHSGDMQPLVQRASHVPPLDEDDNDGTRRNFLIPLPVQVGTYLLSVAGQRSWSVGNYVLHVDLFVGHLENPQPDSPQSGLSVLSGWVCEVDSVAFELEDDPLGTVAAATGTARPDTASECDEKTDTGFGLLYNWNRLGDGEHTVRLVLNDITVETRTVTVTTLGEEFLSGASGETTLADFPTAGEVVRVVWQQAQQNFVLVPPQSVPPTPVPWSPLPEPLIGWWENPQPGSFQSGLSVLSGWVCEADSVVFELEDDPLGTFTAAAGTVRPDTEAECDGQTDTGFGLLYNWNRLGDGEHTVRLVVDGVVIDTRTVTVTTLGEEFRQGLERTETVADFPSPGEVVTVEWQEAQQNFVMTGVGDEE